MQVEMRESWKGERDPIRKRLLFADWVAIHPFQEIPPAWRGYKDLSNPARKWRTPDQQQAWEDYQKEEQDRIHEPLLRAMWRAREEGRQIGGNVATREAERPKAIRKVQPTKTPIKGFGCFIPFSAPSCQTSILTRPTQTAKTSGRHRHWVGPHRS
jgi:hypothetical protein